MAKKASKKPTEAAAKTKSAPGKSPKKVTRGAPIVRSKDAEVAKAQSVESLRKVGIKMMQAPKEAAFSIPADPEKMIKRAIALNRARDAEEVELSALLWEMEEKGLYLTHGSASLMEFANDKLMISASKARTLALNYRRFMEVGLHPKLLVGENRIDYNRFKLLIPAINAQTITAKNIAEWLPKLVPDGPTALLPKDLQFEVRQLVNAEAAKGKADPMKRFSFPVPLSEIDGLSQLIETYQKGIGAATIGDALIQAVNLAASSLIEDDQQSTQYQGIVGHLNMLSRLAPVAPFIVPLDATYDEDNLGTLPVRNVYSYGGKMCLAGSLRSAAEYFGIDESKIKVSPFGLAQDLMPLVGYAGPRTVTEEDVAAAEEAADDEASDDDEIELVDDEPSEDDVELVETDLEDAEDDESEGVERLDNAELESDDEGIDVAIGVSTFAAGDIVMTTKGSVTAEAEVLEVHPDHLVVRNTEKGARKRKVTFDSVREVPDPKEAEEALPDVPTVLAGPYMPGRKVSEISQLVRLLTDAILAKTDGVSATDHLVQFVASSGIKKAKGDEQRALAEQLLQMAIDAATEHGIDVLATLGDPAA